MTQWAEMTPQRTDAFFYAHSINDVKDMVPLLEKFRSTPGRKAYLLISGGQFCPCADAADILGWSPASCSERRFKLFDLEVGLALRNPIEALISCEMKMGM